ncbi:MAG: winged helix-turn-helix transcriptional regulator [Blautia sp.]|nr:winged helix-turn-helix transcriptional regulator [Blautia sp.]
MRYIRNYQEELTVFDALGSEVRLSILQQLMEQGRMSMNDLAKSMGLTNGAITSHVKRLENAGLIRINAEPSGHGNQKICEPHLDKILFVFSNHNSSQNEFHSHLRVGQYSSCKVYPTCGLSTVSSIIGEVDDPRYFTHQKRFEADILWFTRGFVEYMIPCVIPTHSRIEQIAISAELSSEAPGSNAHWPSDIHFYLNGTLVGTWTSPGDFADVPGVFTPDWWYSSWNQYGLLKTLSVTDKGTFIDDMLLSDISISDLSLSPRSPIYFRMAVPDTAEHIGGLTIFGRDFGNYNQDIMFRIAYSEEK